MKKIFIYLTFVLVLGGIRSAYADFEAVETTLGKLEDVQKEAQNVQEELKKVQSEINNVRQGKIGIFGDLVSKIPNENKVGINSSQETSRALEGNGDLEEAAKNDTTATYTDKDQDKTYLKTEDKKEAIRRENLARLYAYAMTLRTNMAKNRKEHKSDDKPVTAEDGREILKTAATKEAAENSRRVAHLWDMQSSIFELYRIEQARLYSDKTPVDSSTGE